MDKKPVDLRIQKTHSALIQALRKLLLEKRFENITVNEICDLAMVRRATFYKHFADKYALFTFMVQSIQEEFWKQSPEADATTGSIEPYIIIMTNTVNFMDKNQALVKSAMDSNVYPILQNIVSEQIHRDIKRRFCIDKQNGKQLLLSANLMAQVYTGALMNVVRWWIRHKEQTTKEEIISQLTILTERLYYTDNSTPQAQHTSSH